MSVAQTSLSTPQSWTEEALPVHPWAWCHLHHSVVVQPNFITNAEETVQTPETSAATQDDTQRQGQGVCTSFWRGSTTRNWSNWGWLTLTPSYPIQPLCQLLETPRTTPAVLLTRWRLLERILCGGIVCFKDPAFLQCYCYGFHCSCFSSDHLKLVVERST